MCGIIGYVGNKPCKEILINGLRQLEYRGYDSAGICILTGEGMFVSRSVGKVANLAERVKDGSEDGILGIAHTRWATHGGVTEENAHPHCDQSGKLFIAHNGIMENYTEIKAQLMKEGHVFQSQTDTEVLAHLIGTHYEKEGDLCRGVVEALKHVVGTYGITVMHADHPEQMVVARNGSPLLLGRGEGFTIVASDPSAIVEHTNRIVYLSDRQVACIRGQELKLMNLNYEPLQCKEAIFEQSMGKAELGDYPHYMLKEIDEQPKVIWDSIRGRMREDLTDVVCRALVDNSAYFRTVKRIQIVSSGSAYRAGFMAKYMIEKYTDIEVSVEFGSEYRYKKNNADPRETMVLIISQSGESADTLAALKEAKRKGFFTFGIVNVVGSTIAREVDAGIYTHAGFEIGVAATKSVTTQLAVLTLLAVFLARQRDMTEDKASEILRNLTLVPDKIEQFLSHAKPEIQRIAKKYANSKNMLFLGRKANYPVALEGALKLLEISYIHADAQAAGEMKHGMIALIEPSFPTFFIATQDDVYEKTVSNIQEVKARNGKIIALVTEGDETVRHMADDFIEVPRIGTSLQPVINVVAMQLFSYYIALELGRDIDKPRNLAKSVTVE